MGWVIQANKSLWLAMFEAQPVRKGQRPSTISRAELRQRVEATLRKRGVSKDPGAPGLSAQDEDAPCQALWEDYIAAMNEAAQWMDFVSDLVNSWIDYCDPPEQGPDDPPPPPPPAICFDLSEEISEGMNEYYELDAAATAAQGAYVTCLNQNG